jgi:hypothetical protein
MATNASTQELERQLIILPPCTSHDQKRVHSVQIRMFGVFLAPFLLRAPVSKAELEEEKGGRRGEEWVIPLW